MSRRFAWPAATAAASALVAVLVALEATAAIRGPVVLLFVLLVPGLAIVRLLHLRDWLFELALAVALGIALAVVVPTTMLYAGAWSPPVSLALIIALALAAAVMEVVQGLRA